MILVLISCGVLGALAWLERDVRDLAVACAGLLFVATALMLVVGDPARAGALAVLLGAALIGASWVKHHHSGMKLAAGDLALTFAGTIPFMVKQYRLAASLTILGAVLLAAAASVSLLAFGGAPQSISMRIVAVVASATLFLGAFRLAGGVKHARASITGRRAYLSTFLGSLIDVGSWWRGGGLHVSDIADTALPLRPARAARSSVKPDIIVIQHESLFDPRLFGLRVEPKIADFFSPPGALSGRLHVDIYGGGSWRSEFSLLTGLSSLSFGPDGYFLFKKGVGRFHHALPSYLATLGYKTMLVTSGRRGFMNYDAFYGAIGTEERIFSDDFLKPFDIEAFERTSSDNVFLAEAGRVLAVSVERDPAPRFSMLLTNFNHGPHDRRGVPLGRFEAERRFALDVLADPHYGEYAARLAESVESWARLKGELAARFPGRPMLVLRYGDHQPTMTRRIEHALGLPVDDPRQFETFWAIEGINFTPDPAARPSAEPLDIAFLGTVALDAAGVALDPVFATRASLIEDCGSAYHASDSARKRGFHRALAAMGAMDLG